MKNLCQAHGQERFEQACQYASQIGTTTFESLRSILLNYLEASAQNEVPAYTVSEAESEAVDVLPAHENIRGEAYYR